jgi:hypothetical protein
MVTKKIIYDILKFEFQIKLLHIFNASITISPTPNIQLKKINELFKSWKLYLIPHSPRSHLSILPPHSIPSYDFYGSKSILFLCFNKNLQRMKFEYLTTKSSDKCFF